MNDSPDPTAPTTRLGQSVVVTPEGGHFRLPLHALRQAAEATDRSFTDQMNRLGAPFHTLDNDEDAAPIESDSPDLQDLLVDKRATIDTAANEARKAYAISAYHLWEHAVARRIRPQVEEGQLSRKQLRASGADLDKHAQAFGWTIDPALPGLRALVNLLKHDNASAWRDLQADWPRQWRPGATLADAAEIGLVQDLRLDQDLLLEIFGIVERSGPRFTRPASADELAVFNTLLLRKQL